MAQEHRIILGIDTHKYIHVAVVLDELGRPGGSLSFPASDVGAAES